MEAIHIFLICSILLQGLVTAVICAIAENIYDSYIFGNKCNPAQKTVL